MREADVEVILERAKEKYPEAKPRIISDNGPQFIARDFKEFIRVSGMTHVRTSFFRHHLCLACFRRTTMMTMTRVTKLGFALVGLGLVPWGCWTVYDSTRTWFFANDVPITLSKGSHYTTGMIKANMSALYSIYIDADSPKGIGDDQPTETEKELACQIGVNDPTKNPCPNRPIWKFHWTLTSDGRTVQEDSDESLGQGRIYSHGSILREIGEFRTEAGRRYKFDLDVLFDNQDPRIVNPRLMVAVSDFQAGSSMFLSGLLKFICLPIAAIGALIILGSLLSEWRQRKRAPALGVR
jgi:hypothetical protein